MAQVAARATIHAMIALCLAVVGCTPLAPYWTTGGWRRPADASMPPPPPPAGFRSVHELIAASRCSIYVNQAEVAGNDINNRSQHSSHYWISQSLASHPWRVKRLSEADIVYFNASLSLSSRGRYKNFGTLQNIPKLLATNGSRCGNATPAAIYATSHSINDRPHDPNTCIKVGCRLPLGIHFLSQEENPPLCPAPHVARRPSPCLRLLQVAVGPTGLDIVTPKVASASLLAGLPPPTPWPERKLLLVVLGRIINPAISTVRWDAWRELHSNPMATVYQYNLKDMWMSAACDLPASERRAVQISECHRVWGEKYDCEHQLQNSKRHHHCRGFHGNLAQSYRAASVEAIRGRFLSEDGFKAEVMKHKFCLIIRGDFASTLKLTEHLALVGSRGCVPVVVKAGAPLDVLPFSAVFNLCRIAFIVDKRVAFSQLMLNALAAVPEREAISFWAEAAKLQDAFLYHEATPEN